MRSTAGAKSKPRYYSCCDVIITNTTTHSKFLQHHRASSLPLSSFLFPSQLSLSLPVPSQLGELVDSRLLIQSQVAGGRCFSTMASDESTRGFAPIRTENILNDQEQDVGEYSYKEDEIERPIPMQSSSSTYVEDGQLSRVQTTKPARERREFVPINPGDREELHRIASQFGGSAALARTKTGASSGLERQDTLAGVNLGDPVLDPTSPEFDTYKWLRM